jgi:hypothetical protein
MGNKSPSLPARLPYCNQPVYPGWFFVIGTRGTDKHFPLRPSQSSRESNRRSSRTKPIDRRGAWFALPRNAAPERQWLCLFFPSGKALAACETFPRDKISEETHERRFKLPRYGIDVSPAREG